MSNLLDAARQALDTLTHIIGMRHLSYIGQAMAESAERTLRAALDARPEPVAWQTQRPVRLTDEQIAFCLFEARVQSGPFKRDGSTSFRFARAVEAEVLRLNGIGGDDE